MQKPQHLHIRSSKSLLLPAEHARDDHYNNHLNHDDNPSKILLHNLPGRQTMRLRLSPQY